MVSRTAAANATAVNVQTANAVVIKKLRCRQFTKDAPKLFLQVHNKNAPTMGTDLPDIVIPIPAGISAQDAMVTKATFYGPFGGAYLATAFSYAVTTTATGLTAPDAGDEPEVEIHYEKIPG